MSWTITEDAGALHVRATLDRADEALDLIERLSEKYKTFEFRDASMVKRKLGYEEKGENT